jgi:putative redox protein
MPENVAVELNLKDLEGMAFDAALPTGHTIVLDASQDHGGENLGPRPMHVMLVALAGCTGMDVISFLRKMRQNVTGYQVKVEGIRRDEDPKIYTSITITHVVSGDVEESKLKRAVDLSSETYCSAQAMLRAVAEIDVKWEIVKG